MLTRQIKLRAQLFGMIIGDPLVRERIAASVNSRSPSDSFVGKDLHPHVCHAHPSFNHRGELVGRSALFCHRFLLPIWPNRIILQHLVRGHGVHFVFQRLPLTEAHAKRSQLAVTTFARLPVSGRSRQTRERHVPVAENPSSPSQTRNERHARAQGAAG